MPLTDELLSGKEVRLFPCHRIGSIREAELRATASFLAVARAVAEFGQRVVGMVGGPAGRLQCYAEIPLKVPTGPKFREERPDGLLRVIRGKTTDWSALVEVKVGDNWLEQDQFDRYHALALDQGINALVTISNQSAMSNGLPPHIAVNSGLLKKVPVVHLSWARLLSEAQLLIRQKAVRDTDQQWILEEWVRYLADPQSRIIEPPQLGQHWNDVLRCAREGNLLAAAAQMNDVVHHWDGFLRKVAMRLRAKLGANVALVISRAEQKDPAALLRNLHAAAIGKGELAGAFRIPDAAGDLSVTVLLAPRSVQYSVDLNAPTEGKAATRIKWLLKQLFSQDSPDDLVVHVDWGYKLSSQGRVRELRENPDRLLWDVRGEKVPDQSMPKSFSLRWTVALSKGKARSTAPILEGIEDGLEEFYRRIVSRLKAYVRKAPQLPKESERSADEGDGALDDRVPDVSTPNDGNGMPDVTTRDDRIVTAVAASDTTSSHEPREDESKESDGQRQSVDSNERIGDQLA